MTKYYGAVVFVMDPKVIYPLDAETDHKPQTESAGFGAFCNWYQSVEDRDNYLDFMIRQGFGLDQEEYDRYYGKID